MSAQPSEGFAEANGRRLRHGDSGFVEEDAAPGPTPRPVKGSSPFGSTSAPGAAACLMIVATGLPLELLVRFLLLCMLLAAVHRSGLPRVLDGVVTTVLLAAAVLAAVDAYTHVWWLDDVAHFLVIAVLAAAGTWVWERRSAPRLARPTALPVAVAAPGGVAFVCGLCFASAWELYELLMVTMLDSPATLAISYGDTLTDVALGGAGALSAGVAAGIRA